MNSLESGPKLPNTWRYKIGSRCWELEDSCRTKVKILVGFCQILVLWPKQILSVRWPDVFIVIALLLGRNRDIRPHDKKRSLRKRRLEM